MAQALKASDSYIFQRDCMASTRLNSQHLVWQRELGFLLHPDIPELPDGAIVADVATGTGAWLLDAAETRPKVKFDGFDISLAQCPAKNLLPPNVDISEWDMFQSPSKDMIAKYDVVSQSLLKVLRLATKFDLTFGVLAVKEIENLVDPLLTDFANSYAHRFIFV